MKKLVLFAVCVCVLACGAVASAGYFTRPLPPNHHIHDCPDNHACGYPHLPVGFFPAILGESRAVYQLDPAECNDATDKALLPPNDATGTPRDNQPLRAGVCYTSAMLIHLRSIDTRDPAPHGWSGPIAPVSLGNGVTYATYWLLTPR